MQAYSIMKTSGDILNWADNRTELCEKFQKEVPGQDLFNSDGTARYKDHTRLWGTLAHKMLGADGAVGEDFKDLGDLKTTNVLGKDNYTSLSVTSTDIPLIDDIYQTHMAPTWRLSTLKVKSNVVVALSLCFFETVNGIRLPRMFFLDALIIDNLLPYWGLLENFYDYFVPRLHHKRDCIQKETKPLWYCKHNQIQLTPPGQDRFFYSQKYRMLFRDSRAIDALVKTCSEILLEHNQHVIVPPFLRTSVPHLNEDSESLSYFGFDRLTPVKTCI